MQHITIAATLHEAGGDEAPERATRYQFRLYNEASGAPRDFIIDIPLDPNESTDVWINNHTVAVGDTPEDGFATFTPIPDYRTECGGYGADDEITCSGPILALDSGEDKPIYGCREHANHLGLATWGESKADELESTDGVWAAVDEAQRRDREMYGPNPR